MKKEVTVKRIENILEFYYLDRLLATAEVPEESVLNSMMEGHDILEVTPANGHSKFSLDLESSKEAAALILLDNMTNG